MRNGSAYAGRLESLWVGLVTLMVIGAVWLVSARGPQFVADGAEYLEIASRQGLEGRAPFVLRPAVPWLAGLAGDEYARTGFVLLFAAGLGVALFAAVRLAGGGRGGLLLVGVLMLNYQVVANALHPARIDTVVLAAQLCLLVVLHERRYRAFAWIWPLTALVKETLLLSMAPVVLALTPRAERGRAFGSAAAFLALHLLVRSVATVTEAVPPHDGGLDPAAALALLRMNLAPTLPLEWLVAFGGAAVAYVVMARRWLAVRGSWAVIGLVAFNLALPLFTVTDVNRAWFDLMSPTLLVGAAWFLRRDSRAMTVAFASMIAASLVPYLPELFGGDHLYLLLLQHVLSPRDWLVAAAAGAAALAAGVATHRALSSRPELAGGDGD